MSSVLHLVAISMGCSRKKHKPPQGVRTGVKSLSLNCPVENGPCTILHFFFLLLFWANEVYSLLKNGTIPYCISGAPLKQMPKSLLYCNSLGRMAPRKPSNPCSLGLVVNLHYIQMPPLGSLTFAARSNRFKFWVSLFCIRLRTTSLRHIPHSL